MYGVSAGESANKPTSTNRETRINEDDLII